jgi:AraC-like DNA-binding protein
MEISQTKMLSFLKEAAKLPFKKIFYAETKPHPAHEKYFVSIQPPPRFIFPLTGDKRIRFAENGEVQDHIFTPGEVLICHPNGWSSEIWDRKHTMISIVFRDRYIRTLFIAHNGLPPDQNGPDIFFHTFSPLHISGSHLLNSILTASKDSLVNIYSFRAMLQCVIETVEQTSEAFLEKDTFLWDCIQDYVETNFNRDIKRENIASALHIHPAHLSRLVQKMTGGGINKYLSRLRMEYAKKLLEDDTLSIKEISYQCGFAYTSYFIKKFRSYYGESPTQFRKKILNKTWMHTPISRDVNKNIEVI